MSHILFVTAWLLVVLGVMVFVHELGHFIVAKLCGVRIETFSLGFGKRLFGFRRGDTDYRVSLLPLGGYVKMAGELGGDGAALDRKSGTTIGGPILAAAAAGEEELVNNTILAQSHPGGDPGDLNSKPRWQRILIALAGPFANFILALVLMTFVFMTHHEIREYIYQPAQLDYVPPSSPAASAGFQSGDKIVLFDDISNPTWEQVGERSALSMNRIVGVTVERNGQAIPLQLPIQTRHRDELDFHYLGLLPLEQSGPMKIASLDPQFPAQQSGIRVGDSITAINGTPVHSTESVASYLQTLNGKPVVVSVLRNNQPMTFNITPKLTEDEHGEKVYRLGFIPEPPPTRAEKLSLPAAFVASAEDNLRNASLIGEVLHRMLTLRMSVRTLSGPVGIGQQVGMAASMPGWTPLIQVMAFISINLGIFNLLPIPILDGGVILFLLIESVLRRDINQHFKERVYQTAFVFLLVFAVLVVANDISKLGLFSHVRP